ncbi:MAG: hypothetical protein MUC91_13670 [Verrucomicrobia bacterium]|nr:hypothetical protein [Verrucomicrobiota bacterium]
MPALAMLTLLRVQLEAMPHGAVGTQTIYVPRSQPIPVTVETLYLLTEENVVQARMVQQFGTYAMEIQFNQWAIPLLEHNSSSHQGRRLAIQAQWGPKKEYARWLAAPKMSKRIINGTITFTPDATLEECQQIVAGLNNNARKVKSELTW